jgi:2-haloacid dehalogenase
MSYRKYREVLGSSAMRVAARMGIQLDPEKSMAFAASVPSWPAFPDTRSSLAELRSEGYKLYILSNVDSDLLEGTIRNSGIAVDGYVTAEDTLTYKPDPGHWEAFMRRSGARKEDILHVAQSVYHDIVPTQKLGIASAWVNRYDEPLPSYAHPSFIVDGLTSLIEVLA